MRHPTSRLAAHEGGSAIIEMALAAPLLAALLIGMVDLSRAYSAKLLVEQGAQRGIERIQREGFEDNDTFKNAVKADVAAGAEVDAAAVTLTSWLECNNNGVKKALNATCNDGESVARYVSIAVQKTYTPLFKARFAGANSDGTYTVHGEAGVRFQ